MSEDFKQRHNEIMKRAPKHPTARLWAHVFVLAAILLAAHFVYIAIQINEASTTTANLALANTGFWLIGASFALSAICYFWDFLDTKIIYRKYLGLVGFFAIIGHAIFSLTLFTLESYFETGARTTAFIAAALSFLILAGMAAISNKYATKELGGKRWRQLLRTGYIAYVLAMIHFVMRQREPWTEWFENQEGLMPLGIITLIIGAAVILLRLILTLSLFSKKRATIQQ